MENDTSKNSGSTDVNSALSALLANEELMKNIRSLFAQPTQQASPTAPTQSTQGSASPSPSAPTVTVDATQEKTAEAPTQQGEILPPAVNLQDLLSNPAVMEKLPQVMAMLSPMMNQAKPSENAKEVSAVPQRFSTQNRESLLCALKPFLSPHRQTAVDSIMRISQLGHILQQLK